MRNVLCPHYTYCLDQAVSAGSDFCCDHCHFEGVTGDIPITDLEGCHLLLWRLFRPDLYQEWVDFQTQKKLAKHDSN